MREPIDPQGVTFQRVSSKLIGLKLLTEGVGSVVVIAVSLIPLVLRSLGLWPEFPLWLAWTIFVATLLVRLWRLALVPRQVRAIGYAERNEDLLIRRGLFFQRVLVVPYGRMQYVDVAVGPLERIFGLSSIKLHTAAAGTHATLEGLPAAEAARLREQLSSLGEAKLAGL